MALFKARYRLIWIDHCIVFCLVLVAKDVYTLELVGDTVKRAKGFNRSRLRLILVTIDEEFGCANASRISHFSVRIIVLGALGTLVSHFIIFSFDSMLLK